MANWVPPEGGVGSSGPPAGGYPPGEKGDKEITTAVETALFLDPIIDERRFAIRTENGVVTMMGTARSESERQRILDLARGIDGVQDVVDQVRIERR